MLLLTKFNEESIENEDVKTIEDTIQKAGQKMEKSQEEILKYVKKIY